MLFKHPELLYGLFLLVIPVLVHLFQLRRFKKEKFTNVKFLKKSVLQTRKSSNVKKWLVLLLRLLIFTCIIVAFAQPYIPSSKGIIREQETIIYLDNSHSMEAQGQNGMLLKKGVQELLEILPKDEKITLFTNNKEFIGADYNILKNELQDLNFSPNQLDWITISGKAETHFSNSQESEKMLWAISDFQVHEGMEEIEVKERYQTYLVKLQSEKGSNIAIDTVFISEQSLDETMLSISIRSFGKEPGEIPLSLYNGPDLLGKRTISLEGDKASTVEFPLPPGAIEQGRVVIEDSGLEFDNTLFFSINKREAINVVVIGDGDPAFLERIYREPEFNLNTFPTSQIDFSELSQANLIILNEPIEISLSLKSSLEQLVKQNVFLVIIPSEQAQLSSYNSLLQSFGLPLFQEMIPEEKLITEISYDHPLFHSVFENETQNFQYPLVRSYFRLLKRGEKVLGLENNEDFLLRKENIFLFTAALNEENSNFQDAPLIVPTFYNLGNLALTPTQLYYILGENSKVDINFELEKDEILQMATAKESFIPLQQSFPNKVVIELQEGPQLAGHYTIKSDSAIVQTLSFNINRQESILNYRNLEEKEGVNIESSISGVSEAVESKSEITELWKWFVIFALFFLLLEMLILKIFK